MRIRILGLVALVFMMELLPLSAKEKIKPEYAVALIDSSLRKDAWAVCREYNHEFVLENESKAAERVHLVITVFSKAGDKYAELVLPYDKSTKIASISGKTYNGLGIYDERLKNSAIQDEKYTMEGTLYDELRLKMAKIETNDYPYTVEYDYEISHEGLIGYPGWHPLNKYHLAVGKATFSISYPEKMEVRYREFNLPAGSRTESTESGIRHIRWQIGSIPALQDEPFSPELIRVTPGVILAPVKFDYCGYPGTMSSWNDFGSWLAKLMENRDQLPVPRQSEIKEMVKGMSDTAQIVRTLYEYMQKRTHYVGIQLGIGGYQPFPAETVDKLGYGDCKALSNYLKAILKTAGINAFYTIAGAGPNQGITMIDFPTVNQCNHVILCVPQQKDTIWLECTSQTKPCGYLGRATEGKKVLIVDPRGSRVVNTPLLEAEQSSQVRTAMVQISSVGSIDAKINTEYSGYQYDNVSIVLPESKKEQEKALYENLSVPGMVISGFDYREERSRVPRALETISLVSRTSTTQSGRRIFVPLNLFNQLRSIPSKVDNRKMPVYREYAFMDADSVVFDLPAGFKPETVPPAKSMTTVFGEYHSNARFVGKQVIYTRKLKMNRGIWPKEQYTSLVDFYTAIVAADKAKLVIKEEPGN